MFGRVCRTRACARALRAGPFPRHTIARRLQSTGTASTVDPKISAIVQEISKLTLLETSVLVSELKIALNIADIAPLAAVSAAPAATAAPAEEAAPVEEKMIFAVKLESFDAKSKPKIIKEVKTLLGVSLVEAKKTVEAAPKVLKEGVPKEDAEKIKQTIEALGGKVTLD